MITHCLSENQIQQVHQTSLNILERIGVEIPHPELLARFADTGASVDFEKKRVKIPNDLVLACLKQAEKHYTLYGSDLTKTARFGQSTRNYNSIAGEALWIDEIGQPRRYTNLNDVGRAASFAEALDSITIPGAMADPAELPVEWRCVAVLSEMLKYTRKPVTLWLHDRASANYIVEMITALRGDKKRAVQFPLTYAFLEPISPLRFPFHGIDLLFETSKINMPVSIGPMAQMGMSAPATIAGTMALENAEILAGICVTQLIKPGTAVCYGGICHAFDMNTTQMIFAGPEQAIFGAAMTQMGKFYELPVYVNVGLTDSKRPDGQAGIEIAATLLPAMAAGADIFGHMGICGVDQAASLDILVLQNEVIRYLESTMRTIDFSEEKWGFDVLENLGPGGVFIDQRHTVTHFRQELWFPKLLDRNYYQTWLDNGQKSTEQQVREFKNDIIATPPTMTLSEALNKTLNEIVASAKRNLGQ